MKTLILIIIITVVVGLLLFKPIKSEGLAIEGLTSDEAIKNVASVYNTDKMTLTNLTVTGALTANTSNLLPKGMIVAWTGGDTPPAGWAICDGTNGTPDLRNKFILGGSPYGQSGGAFTYTLTSAQLPNHTHAMPKGDQNWGNGSGNSFWGATFGGASTGNCNGCQNEPYPVTPPYYRLAFIMKL